MGDEADREPMGDEADQEGTRAAVSNTADRASLPGGPGIPALHVTGLVVTKAELIAALRLYIPHLCDITPLDAERFLLSLFPIVP